MPAAPCWPEFFGHLNLEIAGLHKKIYFLLYITQNYEIRTA